MADEIDAIQAIKQFSGMHQTRLKWWLAYAGDGQGNIYTSQANYYLCRYPLSSSPTVEIYNNRVSLQDGLRIIVGYTAYQPNLLQVLDVADQRVDTQDPNDNPIGPGGPGYSPVLPHWVNHQYLGSDSGLINWRQLSSLGVFPTYPASFSVQVWPGTLPRPGADVNVAYQLVDLTSHVPLTAGAARYVLISYDSAGAVTVTDGADNPGGFAALSNADIPDTPAGNWRSAAVALYEGQTAIVEKSSEIDFLDLRFPEEATALDTNFLNWYVAEDYGADPTATSDSTSALQTILGLIDSSGARSATIYFKTFGGRYKIAGALQDPTGANAQVVLPSRALSDQELTIRFKGPTRPSFMWNTVDPMPAQVDSCATLVGTLTGQSGTACMIGSIGPLVGGSFAGANYITTIFEDLTVELPANPSYTAIDGSNMTVECIGLEIHCGEFNVATMTQPTHSNAYGIKLTNNNLQGYTHVQGLMVVGFYYGMTWTEFTNADGLRMVGCQYAYEVPFMHHPIVIQSAGYYDCPYGIIARGDGPARLTIQNFDIERANHTTAPAWCWSVSDLEDSGNDLYGFLSWISIQGGVGNDHTFIKTGGTHLQTIEIDTFFGDVTGPASAGDGNIAIFDGATGKLIKDSGATVTGLGSEVLMADGITPPDPLTTDDETDWLYGA